MSVIGRDRLNPQLKELARALSSNHQVETAAQNRSSNATEKYKKAKRPFNPNKSLLLDAHQQKQAGETEMATSQA